MFRHLLKSLLIGAAIMWPFTSHAAKQTGSAYDFSFKALTSGEPLPLSQYKGKVMLVVNTASACGFTPQYQGLEALNKKYRERGLVVIGVPSNDFGSQEPGDSTKIANFCQINYGVSFPMATKVQVKGDEAHPFYQWTREQFGVAGAPLWNFHKYLIDRNGKLVTYFHSTTEPESTQVVKAIETALAAGG